MTITEALDILENLNKWRRGAEIPQPDPTKVGLAIDFVINFVKN